MRSKTSWTPARPCRIRRRHIRELRVPTSIRQLHRVQHRRFWRPRVVGMIRMPTLTGNVTRAVSKTILIGDVMNFWALRNREPRVVLMKNRSEHRYRRQHLRWGQTLAAHHQHPVLDKRTVEYRLRLCRNRLSQIDPDSLRTRVTRQTSNVHCRIPSVRPQPTRPLGSRHGWRG